MEFPDRFGQRLRELRHRSGLTQAQLGERAGVDYKYIGGIERGQENPSLSIISRLASGLEVEPMELFDAEHQLPEDQLRTELERIVRDASGEDLPRLYRVLRALTS